MKLSLKYFLVLLFFYPTPLLSKGDNVGFWMEGTVSELETSGEKIQFKFNGQFWIVQYHNNNNESRIEFKTNNNAQVSITQNKPFFAMSKDWGGGAIRNDGNLLKILKVAEKRRRVVKFQLIEPAIDFREFNNFTLIDAKVIRATDADIQ